MNILILCDEDATLSPRPSRLICNLSHHNLFLIHASRSVSCFCNLTFCYDRLKPRCLRDSNEEGLISAAIGRREFDSLIFTENRDCIFKYASELDASVDLIVVESIVLLPHAVKIISSLSSYSYSKIAVDLREFYPLEYPGSSWEDGLGLMFSYICDTYLNKADILFSVNESIARKYEDSYGVRCEVLLSLPPYHNLSPSPVAGEQVKVLYHGLISSDRESFNLLEIFDGLDGYSIDILACSNQPDFLSLFKERASTLCNVNILDPIDPHSLITFGNGYDVGIISLAPNSFNNAHALPNKFFEYVQSRLCVVSTPVIEVKRFVDLMGVGFTSDDYSVGSFKSLLRRISRDDIYASKLNSHRHSSSYNLTRNKSELGRILCLGE